MGFNKRKTNYLVPISLLLVFFTFVLLHERHVYNEAQSAIEKHAFIISDALWNFNTQGASEYLSLACKSNNYKQLVVTDIKGKVFQKIAFTMLLSTCCIKRFL